MTDIATVAEFMDTDFITFSPEMSLKEALNTLIKKNLLAALVVENGDSLVGILSE